MDLDDYRDESLTIEAQVARALGDEDWEDLADETPRWVSGGTVAKRYERDRMTFDRKPHDDNDWRN